LFERYERRVNRVLNSYIQTYFETYPVRRDLTVAKEFLDSNYGQFIKTVTEIAFECVRAENFRKELFFRLIDHAQRLYGSLFREIMLETPMCNPSCP
jgi:hypothetical protein